MYAWMISPTTQATSYTTDGMYIFQKFFPSLQWLKIQKSLKIIVYLATLSVEMI
jgi:hypothetical protein